MLVTDRTQCSAEQFQQSSLLSSQTIIIARILSVGEVTKVNVKVPILVMDCKWPELIPDSRQSACR